MYAICIKDNKSPIGYSLYSGFKTINGMDVNPAELKESSGFYVSTFETPDAKILTCMFFLSAEYTANEITRITNILKDANNEKLPVLYAKHMDCIKQDLLNYR